MRRLLSPVAFLVVAAIVIPRISSDLSEIDSAPAWRWICAAALLYSLFYLVIAAAWAVVARPGGDEEPAGWGGLVLAFHASQPYKYLPTSLFTFSARWGYAVRAGLGRERAAAASLMDAVLLIGTGVAVWLVGLWPVGTIVVPLAVLIGSTSVEPLMARWRNAADRWRAVPEPPLVSRGAVLGAGLLYFIGWMIAGLALVATVRAFDGPADAASTWEIVRVNAGAFAASIVAVFAPGGLGVREALLLEAGVDGGPVIAWRILTAGYDVLAGAVAMAALARLRGVSRPPTT